MPELSFANQALRRLRLRHLELLHYLAEVPTVGRAAELLNLSQPATTKMIQEIEGVCGTALFRRGRRGIEPNDQGLLLIRYATVLVHQIESAGHQLHALKEGGSTLLRVGASSTMPLLARASTHLRESIPGLTLHVIDEPTRYLITRLIKGELDCVLAPLPPDALVDPDAEKLHLEDICSDHLCVVASPEHRTTKKQELRWSELIAEPWILSPIAALTRRLFIEICLHEKVAPPRPVVECVSFGSIRWLLRSDPKLLALMRHHQAVQEEATGMLTILPVDRQVKLPSVSLISRIDSPSDPTSMAALLQALRTPADKNHKNHKNQR